MEKPNYVLKTQEAIKMPGKQGFGFRFIKTGAFVIAVAAVFGAIFFDVNMGLALLLFVGGCFLAVAVDILGWKKRGHEPSPIELQFYDRYLVIFRPKRYYHRGATRMEYLKMMYSDIKRCVYQTHSRRVRFNGNIHTTWYDYDAYGRLPSEPTYDRMRMDISCDFSTLCAPGVDFKAEIEGHSPIKVEILST